MDQFPVPQAQAGLPDIADRQKLFEQMSGEAYTGYITLIQSNADLAKPPHRLPMGTWAFVENKKATSLGETFDAVVIDFRPCCRIVDKRSAATKITSVYNPEDPRYSEIIRVADAAKQDPTYVNYWGFEYLIWIPSIQKFATFYANSKTARRAAKEQIHPLLSDVAKGDIKVVQFGSTFIETASYSWFGPTAEQVEIELSAVPEEHMITRIWTAFLDAMKSTEAYEEVEETAVAEDDNR